MKINFKVVFTVIASAFAAFTSCEKSQETDDPVSFEGIIINEVYPAQKLGKECWFELYNKNSKAVDLKGMKIFLSDDTATGQLICTLEGGTIEGNGYFVVSSLTHNLKAQILNASFEELFIKDTKDFTINSFSITYDWKSTIKPEDGSCYARIPDTGQEWAITKTPTPGSRNIKITPHTLKNLVINEVCPSGKWVEMVNTGADLQMEYAYIKAGSSIVFTFPEKTVLKSGERIAADCDCSSSDLAKFDLYDNQDKKNVSFDASSYGTLADGSSWSRLPDTTGEWTAAEIPTKGEVNVASKSDETGLVLNEVSPVAGWVEIANSTVFDINTKGVKVKCDGKTIWESGERTIKAGEHIAFDASVSGAQSFILTGSNGVTLDSFATSSVADKRASTASTSWSRIPDFTGRWYTVITPSKNEANYGIKEGNSIAIWVNHSSMNSIDLLDMCKKGIGNIVIHEYIFRTDLHSSSSTDAFIAQAHSLGMKIHVWMQCFWWNDATQWRSAVIDRVGDTPARYNQPEFDAIINRGLPYIERNIDGIHFDYIRFGGSGGKHNWPEDGITAIGAITEFCRQASVAFKGKKADLILSAALMGETGAQGAYGQEPSEMTKYIDVLMPMAYISSYGYTDTKNAQVADWFKNRSNGKPVWHGISTYNSSTVGLTQERILHDCQNIADNSKADGIALFRYGLGDIPNLNVIY